MDKSGSESSSDSEHNISSKYLLKKIKKLEKKIGKNKYRRHKRNHCKSRSRESRDRSRSRSRSRSIHRSRSVLSQFSRNRRSPSLVRRATDYRSPRGVESGNGCRSVDRSPCEPAYASEVDDDRSLREATSNHDNAAAINITQTGAEDDSPVLQIHDASLTDDFLLILGDDPKTKNNNSFQLHDALTTRWGHILKHGIGKDQKEKLLERYALPNNCEELTPPLVNPEVIGVLSNPHIKRDQAHLAIQTQLNTGLSALGKGLGIILEDKENIGKELKEQLLTCLGDSGRILSDLSNNISTMRRSLITPSLNKTIKDLVDKTVPENFLFGKELGEKIKEAKSIDRARKDLKPDQQPASTSYAHNYSYKRASHRPGNSHFQNNEGYLNKRRPVRRGEAKPQRGQYPRKDIYRRKRP